jgi:PIN domain nuclease of toxin-antitoxin system
VRILLDTHALLWWLGDDDRLGGQARELIRDRGNEIMVSVASLWEIVVKVRVGKLTADVKDIADAVEQEDFELLHVGVTHLLTLGGLPTFHRDPFDHLLIAQAITEGATFMSEDRNVSRYPLRYLTCTDSSPS